MVSEKEVGCDDIDKDDKDGVTRLTGRRCLQDNGLHRAILG